MDFWRSIEGMIEAELTTADAEAAFAALNAAGIALKNLRQTGALTYSFSVPHRKYTTSSKICHKRGESLHIRKRYGIYWAIRGFLARPVLAIGTLLLTALVLWIPSRVFFVTVEGNTSIPEKGILEAAENCGITFGASRREVRSEKVKNALLSEVPQLQWAGVNTTGCTATVSVREKADPDEQTEKTEPASIVADRDGYILSCTAEKGSLAVVPGQTVLQGQTLISAYTDCGLSIRAEHAEGEIMAQTNRALRAVMPQYSARKAGTGEVKRKYSLLIRKKRIFLWKDSGIWDGSCGRMYEEYYITLPGGFRLPIALCVEEFTRYEGIEISAAEEQTEAELKAFARSYLLQQMVAGKILSGIQSISAENGVYVLTGDYACVEMIGKVRQEQMGDTNGKDS